MENNDLIRRGDAIRSFEDEICDMCADIAAERINAIPAVQQMGAVEYARSFGRMCASHTCGKCPFLESEKFSAVSCVKFEREYPEEAVAIVQKRAAGSKE